MGNPSGEVPSPYLATLEQLNIMARKSFMVGKKRATPKKPKKTKKRS